MSAASDDSLAAIREGVRQLCARFPGPYWRELDERRAYPAEFVRALTEAGYLACLIPAFNYPQVPPRRSSRA